MSSATIGVIGGSGLYAMPELKNPEEVRLSTPFGDPSDAFIVGELEGRRVAFLPRHGRGHRLNPSEVPARANIYAFKLLGVRALNLGQCSWFTARRLCAGSCRHPRSDF
jgi:5'-methylthioadenosine phosphorylase